MVDQLEKLRKQKHALEVDATLKNIIIGALILLYICDKAFG